MKKMFLLLLCFITMNLYGQERIILLNEGNWQADNGKISYFEDGRVLSNQWFRDVNKRKLGDTPNDIIQINKNLIAITINWSNIIQFISPDGKRVAETEDVPNNRKLATDGKYVYVSSYGHECGTIFGYVTFTKGYVAKIDIETFKVVATCEVGYEPEGIAYYNGYLFVANTGGYAFQEDHEYETTVSIINAETMQIEKNIDTGQINLYGKLSQSGQYLCINSPGDYYDIPAATVIFDCEKALAGGDDCFVLLEYASTYSCTMLDGNFLAIGARFSYYTNEYKFNYLVIDPHEVIITDGAGGVNESLPGTMLADLKALGMPYGVYVNPYTGYIYATDAGSFAAAGALVQWSPDGTFLGRHKVYINPAHFLALPPDGVDFTGIEQIADGYKSTKTDGVYDLRGMRVGTAPTEGVYIQNGKKIFKR
jgi:DNA-binding beta-propeller fold protein YncE